MDINAIKGGDPIWTLMSPKGGDPIWTLNVTEGGGDPIWALMSSKGGDPIWTLMSWRGVTPYGHRCHRGGG